MPAHKAGLLFVNKTPSSRSLSNSKGDSESLKEIHQHVQKSRDYEKEKENKRKLKRARLLPVGWTPITVAPKQAPPAATALPTTGPNKPPSKNPVPLAIRIDATRRAEADSRCCASPGCSHALSTLALAIPTGGSVEPFGQFRVSMDAEKHRIMEYFVLKFFPAVTRSDVHSFMGHPAAASQTAAVQIIRRALSDELHILALMAAASARMKYVERHHFDRTDLAERLGDATLQLLRRYLAQRKPITHELVQSILYLWAFESYRRNWEAVWTHGKMIMYLADNYLGGFRGLDPYMRRMLWLADRFQAAATQSPPLIKEQWETEELLPQQYTFAVGVLRELDKQPMGYGFYEAHDSFSDKFRGLLNSVLDLCCIVHCHWIGIPEQGLMPSRNWAIARSYFVADELINFKDSEATNESPEKTIQECLRLALIVWMAFVPASNPYAAFVKLLSLRAAVDTKSLRHGVAGFLINLHERPLRPDDQYLLLWVSGLGAVTSEGSENQEWFSVQFQRLAKMLGVFSWDDFVPIQERFLMLDTLKPGNLTYLTWLLQRAVQADVA